MAERPTTKPRWATNDLTDPESGQSNVVEPSESRKDSGWDRNQKPPRQFFNWLGRLVYNWIEWFDDVIQSATAAATAERLMRRDTNGRAQVADPAVDADIATQGSAQGQVDAHANETDDVHGAPSGENLLHEGNLGTAAAQIPTNADLPNSSAVGNEPDHLVKFEDDGEGGPRLPEADASQLTGLDFLGVDEVADDFSDPDKLATIARLDEIAEGTGGAPPITAPVTNFTQDAINKLVIMGNHPALLAGDDGNIDLIGAAFMDERRSTGTGIGGAVVSIDVHPSGSIYAGGIGGPRLERLRFDFTSVWTANPSSDTIWGLAIDSVNEFLYTIDANGIMRKWDAANGTEVVSSVNAHSGITGTGGKVLAIDGHHVYTCGDDNTVRKGNLSDLSVVDTFTGHTDNVEGIAVDDDPGGFVYSVSRDNTVRKIRKSDMGQVWSFTGHTNNTNDVEVDRDGNVYSVSIDQTLRKIDSDGNQVWSATEATSNIRHVTIDLLLGRVFTGEDTNKTVRSYDLDGNPRNTHSVGSSGNFRGLQSLPGRWAAGNGDWSMDMNE